MNDGGDNESRRTGSTSSPAPPSRTRTSGPRIEPLSHTADVGFQVEAPSLDALFQGAARGLALMLVGEDAGEPSSSEDGESWTLERPDLERLLVAWLRELLHRAQSEGKLVARTRVAMTGPAALEARVSWWPEHARPDLVREIKGVTYHGLEVEEGDDGWRARVVLDV